MALPIEATGIALADFLKRTGLAQRVAENHEPTSPPGKRLTFAFWPQSIRPIAEQSGLAATSVRLEYRIRLYLPLTTQPYDGIDPELLGAVDILMAAFSGDFDLGGVVESVDLLGRHGVGLMAEAGYLDQGGLYRVYDITLPLILNDVYEQAS